jgi:NADPH:quinone reductase-like Zn-dependent oxidoreductase
MRAVVCSDFGEWDVERVPIPEPASGEALIEVPR